ncbi:MAG: YsnF/AvaK domain-containing protein [Chloroflexi bacterium]|nr:YsnF/AvaK domain-containing protein [Chloroflexota bacterium]
MEPRLETPGHHYELTEPTSVLRRQAPAVSRRPVGSRTTDAETMRLHEEELVARAEAVPAGEVVVRTETDEVPRRLEVEAVREEAEIEHVPVGRVVSERAEPWEDASGDLVIPVYEEQLVVVKRLVLSEEVHVRRRAVREHQVFEDTVRRDRLVVEEVGGQGLVHEMYADESRVAGPEPNDDLRRRRDVRADPPEEQQSGGFIHGLVRKALE